MDHKLRESSVLRIKHLNTFSTHQQLNYVWKKVQEPESMIGKKTKQNEISNTEYYRLELKDSFLFFFSFQIHRSGKNL